MRLRLLATASLVLLTLASAGCNGNDIVSPPSPTAIINSARDRLNPFRFTLSTDPASPSATASFTINVHVIDATGQPAEGVDLEADLATTGMGGSLQHVTFDDNGAGDYSAEVNLPEPGGWDIDLTASKKGKTKHQRFYLDVSG